jgi:hypothetical protein
MKHFTIRLIKDVTIHDELTYEPVLFHKAGTQLQAYAESSEAYFVGHGYGIWKSEAVKV